MVSATAVGTDNPRGVGMAVAGVVVWFPAATWMDGWVIDLPTTSGRSIKEGTWGRSGEADRQ